MIYQKDSSKAEEFIHHEEILDTLEYAQNNKDNRVLIEQLIEKAALCKGLTHREAAILLECNQPASPFRFPTGVPTHPGYRYTRP